MTMDGMAGGGSSSSEEEGEGAGGAPPFPRAVTAEEVGKEPHICLVFILYFPSPPCICPTIHPVFAL